MDSMSNLVTPYTNLTVKGVKKMLVALGVLTDDTLAPVPVKVSLYSHNYNKQYDGVHMI